MSAAEDALDVARFCWPDKPWQVEDEHGDPTFVFAVWHHDVRHSDKLDEAAWSGEDAADIAAAERVLVERGLKNEYGRELIYALREDGDVHIGRPFTDDDATSLATAPLDLRLRAMARVVREQQPKEKA